VHDNIINRDAESSRKALIALAQRNTAIVADELLANLVQESSSDTRTNMTAHLSERSPEEAGSITY
jgi:hypothetical protein